MSALPEGISLRPATPADAPFLRALYEASEPLFATLPLTGPARAQLLDLQLRARDASETAHHPAADHAIVTRDGAPVGRLVVDRSGEALHVLDLALLPTERGHGLGSALLRAVQAEALTRGGPVTLWAALANPARALYARLGFVETAPAGAHVHLRWEAP